MLDVLFYLLHELLWSVLLSCIFMSIKDTVIIVLWNVTMWMVKLHFVVDVYLQKIQMIFHCPMNFAMCIVKLHFYVNVYLQKLQWSLFKKNIILLLIIQVGDVTLVARDGKCYLYDFFTINSCKCVSIYFSRTEKICDFC